MSKGLVSIVIVTCGAEKSLQELLDSVGRQTFKQLETVIIDNSPGGINASPGPVRVYSPGKNLFYCQALNTGIRMSSGEFILCLNDDIILADDFIEKALRGFGVSPDVGMVSSKVLRSGGKKVDSAGLAPSLYFTAKDRGYSSPRIERFGKEGYVFGVNGAVAFYRRKMLEEIKLGGECFDEEYRIFYEDLDLAWRAQNSGWRCYYVPEAVAFHSRGLTVRMGRGIAEPFARRYLSDELQLHLFKNRYMTIIKNASAAGFILRLPFILLYDLASFVYMISCRPRLFMKLPSVFSSFRSAFIKRKTIKRILPP